jgi:hypothetical protein
MKKHTHKYERTELGSKGYTVYKCMIPDCPHFIEPRLVVGRLSICHGCDGELILTKTMINIEQIKRPVCEECKAERIRRRKELQTIGEKIV